MLRKRVIGLLPLRHGIVVQSYQFSRYRPLGNPDIIAEYLDRWGIDEILLVDIGATKEGRLIGAGLVAATAKRCSVPLAVGGGVTSVEQARALLKAGADKVVVNSAVMLDPTLVDRLAHTFGEQCVVVSFDVFRSADRRLIVSAPAATDQSIEAVDWLRRVQRAGAGELLVQSVDRDGMRNGFDLEIGEVLAASAHIPVILAGGAGEPDHIRAALMIDGIQAVAIGNMFAHTEQSVTAVKSNLRHAGVDIRLDTAFEYCAHPFEEGRPSRLEEARITEYRAACRPGEAAR